MKCEAFQQVGIFHRAGEAGATKLLFHRVKSKALGAWREEHGAWGRAQGAGGETCQRPKDLAESGKERLRFEWFVWWLTETSNNEW
ncbi:hypothetical protein ES705_21802 [subsurface metagenome]